MIDLAADLGHPADYLVRARHDRALEDGGKLRAEVEGQAPLGEVEFRLPPAPGRKERTVTQTLRVAREESPPEWLLLTNKPKNGSWNAEKPFVLSNVEA